MQKELTAAEQSFLYQMSDMLSLSSEKSDNGGQSLQMKFLTEEEANAADAIDWNSKRAYGASEEDLVTFLEVRGFGLSALHLKPCIVFMAIPASLHV